MNRFRQAVTAPGTGCGIGRLKISDDFVYAIGRSFYGSGVSRSVAYAFEKSSFWECRATKVIP